MTDNVNVETIFGEAIEIASPNDRAAYLDRACADDPFLRHEAEKLVADYFRAGKFLEQPLASIAAPPMAPLATEKPGDILGPYKLLEQIGEGGMGLVFMAEQTQPVRRKVALKVLKPGMDTRHVVARFEAERQAVALMDHPNIAQVFDAGATSTGRPYFVMELVRGVPITEFCDQRRLTTRQRLELFVTVCQAVQHAHQKGIIHRDLKPSNILVTLHDTIGVPKIIDFGIAKATKQPLTEQSLFTHFSQMIGTPLYMSPEQAEMNGLDVDTRSDVYALGVLLYELLTGTTPFASARLKQIGFDEMRRVIREEEPPRPSQRVSTLQAAARSTLSEQRGTDVRTFESTLRGELDWIVVRALEKDRNRRYESASAFAADVQRYLKNEAVEACPPSAGYRLRKCARRNRRILVTVGIVAVALVAATSVSTWQAIEANSAGQLADKHLENEKKARLLADERLEKENKARKEAATESAIARAVNDFLQDDLLRQVASAPPLDRELGGDPYLTVKEALDRAAARIDERFRDQPLVEAAIRMAIGEGYISLNDNPHAVPHLERALALRKTQLGPDDPNTFRSMETLAQSCRGVVGRHSEEIALRQQLLQSRQALLGPDHPEVLERVGALADAYRVASELDKSRQLHEQLLEKRLLLFGPVHSATLDAMLRLAGHYRDEGQIEDAIKLNEKVLEILKAKKESEGAFFQRTQLAQGCMRAGKFDQADRLLRENLRHYRTSDDSHAQRLGLSTVLGWLADNLLLQEKYADAEVLAREAVAISEKITPNTYRRFYWVSVLGATLLGQQKYTEAETLLLRGYQGMEPQETINPESRRNVIEAAGWIVRFYEATNQPKKASAWRDKMKSKVSDAASNGLKVIRE